MKKVLLWLIYICFIAVSKEACSLWLFAFYNALSGRVDVSYVYLILNLLSLLSHFIWE